MARSPFVTTTRKRLDLAGDWEGEHIEVKEFLGVKDQRAIDGSGIRTLTNVGPGHESEEAEAGIDLANLYMTQLKTYLVEWSFRDKEGKPIEVTPTAIDMLDPECADEMSRVIRKWLEERAAAKAANPTTTTSSALRSA